MTPPEDTATRNRRIAKNTAVLYVRMLFMMLITLYTSRVILQTLGVEDYGIYGVSGGLVGMISLISGALSSSISRFITFELGKSGDGEKLRHIFSASVTIQIGLAIVALILLETVGYWFLNVRLTIPPERLAAANWVYQFSVLTFCVSMLMTPYDALIVAHERMSAFAYISIFSAVGKLVIAFMITISPIDRLVWYAGLILLMTLTTQAIYIIYCFRQFPECAYKFVIDGKLFKRMASFAGWNYVGATASILREQGSILLLNIFFGPAVNAARVIAGQVTGAVTGFVSNFQTALRPQITKTYAAGETEYTISLIIQGSRVSYYILLILALPFIVNANYIITLWLGQSPAHTTAFTQLALVCALCDSVVGPLITAMLATERIRNFQLVVGGLNLLTFPLTYIVLKLGGPPEGVMVVALVMSPLCTLARVIMLRPLIRLSLREYFWRVCVNLGIVTVLAATPAVIMAQCMQESLLSCIASFSVCFIITPLVILFVGCKREERQLLVSETVKIFRRATS